MMDAIFKFHKYGFKTVAVVFDEASPHLSKIKMLKSISNCNNIFISTFVF